MKADSLTVELAAGGYVLAVSGGVDSVVLLDAISKLFRARLEHSGSRLIVAHYDHGIRPDSHLDCRLVKALAKLYGWPFVYEVGHLGEAASEDTARRARYGFLRKVSAASGGWPIVTAHHEDDVIETALINMLRGTGRRGLSSLKSDSQIVRPLLGVPKADILRYAQLNRLAWREDSTNLNLNYRRNYIRHQLIPRLSAKQRQVLKSHLESAAVANRQIDAVLENLLHIQPRSDIIDRRWFIALPRDVAVEFMAAWLRRHQAADIDRRLLGRVVAASKTLPAGKQIDICLNRRIRVEKHYLVIMRLSRQSFVRKSD